ncbi:hypothetical protein BCR42DRAFT_403619 [Absidia repens]|uniref:Uncharacterized protein n=1 Tax=Absidia repens TaxID=90262 RepID=A0A1X2IV48_9FUNG|nr:hypothetical protein BCR42DRAFT_403619 [Absidia repens]
MQRTDSVFSDIYVRKTPIITYKRKQQPYDCISPKPLTSTSAISTTTLLQSTISSRTQPSSPTKLTPRSAEDEKENTEILDNNRHATPHTIDLDSAPPIAKDIFDLSDDDSSETQVEIRVASSLHSNNSIKSKSANPNQRTKHKKTQKTPTKPTPNTNGTLHQKKSTTQTRTKPPPSFTRTLSAPASTTTTSPSPIIRTMSMIPRLPDTKRRKRNLVAQLKAANGERPELSTQSGGNRFYVDDDDDDDDHIEGNDNGDMLGYLKSNDYHVPTERSNMSSLYTPIPTPSSSSSTTSQAISAESTISMNDYTDRMEQELANLMRTEFGDDDLDDSPSSSTSSSSSSHRGGYVPENTIRAPVTYKRVNNNRTFTSALQPLSSSPLSLSGLDHDMEQQIEYLLSGNF